MTDKELELIEILRKFHTLFPIPTSLEWSYIMPTLEKINKDYHIVIHDHECSISNADISVIGKGRGQNGMRDAVVEAIRKLYEEINK